MLEGVEFYLYDEASVPPPPAPALCRTLPCLLTPSRMQVRGHAIAACPDLVAAAVQAQELGKADARAVRELFTQVRPVCYTAPPAGLALR